MAQARVYILASVLKSIPKSSRLEAFYEYIADDLMLDPETTQVVVGKQIYDLLKPTKTNTAWKLAGPVCNNGLCPVAMDLFWDETQESEDDADINDEGGEEVGSHP